MHIFGVIVWLGGLMFQNAVVQPIVNFESPDVNAAMRKVFHRFTGFIWMSVWTVFVTGAILMLLNPRFFWFRYDDRWSVLLGFKQLIFILMIVYAFGHARMLASIDRFLSAADAEASLATAIERAGESRPAPASSRWCRRAGISHQARWRRWR